MCWGGTRTGFNPHLGPYRLCCVGGSPWVSCSPRRAELSLPGQDTGLPAGELLCSPPESQLSHSKTHLWQESWRQRLCAKAVGVGWLSLRDMSLPPRTTSLPTPH